MKLLRVKQEYLKANEVKWFWRFYLVLDNGSRIEIKPIHYTKSNGVVYDNTRELVTISYDIL